MLLFDRAHGCTSEHGRKDEVIPWTDNGNVVLIGIDVLEEGGRAPSRTEYYYTFLLLLRLVR